MKHTASVISRYTADISGVCSALYELGGMTVMHDAGGYGSLYATHDEPRWYNSESLIFVSGLTETQAILGDDSKFVEDTIQAANRLHPKFISLTGSPIPMVIGTDFVALALEVEQATGIPTLGFDTDGMHSYITGINEALALVANRFCTQVLPTQHMGVNILGVTPLDFSINGTAEAFQHILEQRGFTVISNWAMNSTFADLQKVSSAQVNLVVSSGGLKVARLLKDRFGTPYVVGTPYGEVVADQLIASLKRAIATGENQSILDFDGEAQTMIIGETVTSMSLATALFKTTGHGSTVICPVDDQSGLMNAHCLDAHDEDDVGQCLANATTVIADPLYQPICPKQAHFVALPHEAFSGRIYHDSMYNLVSDFDQFLTKI